MRDLKHKQKKTKKVHRNRRKHQREPLRLSKLLRRALRIGVAVFSVTMILVGGFFATQFLLASDLFKIDEITVQESLHLTEQQVVALSDIKVGVNTFSLDLGLIGRKIEENPWVSQASVRRIFPRQVVIDLVERKPVAIINLGLLYYLDKRGEIFKVLGAGDDLDYPVITGFDYAKAQQHDATYAKNLRHIIDLFDDLKTRELFGLGQVSEVHHDASGGLTLFTLDGGVKIKLGGSEFEKKIDRLERIYTQLRPQLKMVDYIDLNVDEKVIVRIEKQSQITKS